MIYNQSYMLTIICYYIWNIFFGATKIIYSRCHSLAGIKDVLYNKFSTLRIGQNCGSMCKSMVVMEMNFQQREREAQVPHTQEARLAGHQASSKARGEVDYSLSYTCISSLVVSMFK